jgi:NADPH-dependent 2,4-dienoyl-CoA reductase/sulfur reductase-like enzyme
MGTVGQAAGIVIVGGGHAGGRTAERLRAGGFDGPIDIIGIETELPYERPPLSKSALMSAETPTTAQLLPAAKWNEIGVAFHLGAEVTGIDRQAKAVRCADGAHLPYSKLVLATGLSPRRIAALDPVAESTACLRSFEDAVALRRRIVPGASIVLVGAGLIGLEVAASAVKLGARVTVLEAAERPLSRLLPAYLSRWLAEVHRQAGVRLLFGRQVVSSTPRGTAAVLDLDDGSTVEADLVLACIGGTPNDRLARDSGLDVGDGIIVNEFGQTSDPDIFAVGDVANHENPFFNRRWRLESWKNAEDQARIAASCLCGDPVPYREVPWFWTDQYDLNIQIAGVPGAGDPSYERGEPGSHGYLAYFTEAERIVGAVGIGCGRDIRMAREAIKRGGLPDAATLARSGLVPSGVARRAS